MTDEVSQRLFEAIATNRLVVLCGAGLSMAPPSSLPSANRVAELCSSKYQSMGSSRLAADIEADLEKIAKHFGDAGRFETVFIDHLVPWPEFKKGEPNAGHRAISDLLACNVLFTCITTNFDVLVERAADRLGEPDFTPIVEAAELSRSTPYSPYLKLHGCMGQNRYSTIWYREQLAQPAISDRISHLKTWLLGNIAGKDLLIIGFWTDWAHLTEMLANSLAGVTPRHAYVVNPDSAADLEAKAPQFWNWVHSHGISFHHVQESGADFLEDLRMRWGRHFLTQLSASAHSTYEALFMATPSLPSNVYDALHSEELYALRRDLTGTPRTAPVRERQPLDIDHVAAAIHTRLLEAGASYSEHQYSFRGDTFRLVSGRGKVLSVLKAAFQHEPPIPAMPTVVCAGALPDASPGHIVRASGAASIVRAGGHSDWVTHEGLVARLRGAHV